MALLKITKRDQLGTRYSRQLHRQGFVPAIVYGHGEPNSAVALPGREIERIVRKGEHLVKADLEGQEQNFLIKDVQFDYLGKTVIHVDLTRVRLDETVEVTVPIILRGAPVGVETEGGVLTQALTQIEVSCLVTAIPDEIRVNVAGMHLNDVLRVKDLKLPEGVKAVENAEAAVASITMIAEEVAATPAAEGEVTAVEPEVIGAKPAEEGEEAAEEPEKKEKKEKKE